MPIMDGYTATRQIKADPAMRSIPIIAVTSHALDGEEQKRERQDVTAMGRSLTARDNYWRKFSSACLDRSRSIASSRQFRVMSAIWSLRPALTRCGNMRRSA